MAAAFAPTLALAQTAPRPTPTPPPTSNSATSDTVGPSELQNFSLKGTVERQADQPAVVTPSRPQTAPVRPPAVAPSPPRQQGRNTERIAPPPGTGPQQVASAAPQVTAPAETQAPPIFQQPLATAPTPIPESLPAPAQASGFFSELPLFPWIAAAIALLGGTAFLLWRRRQQQPLPAGAQFDLLVGQAPEPEPVARKPEPVRPPLRPATPPQPEPKAPPPFSWRPSPTPGGEVTTRPAPARREPVRSTGIVASKLRPALELGFHPLRCEVNDDQVAIEFELELFNAGAAPARAVFAEASLLNASATQDAELQAFFSNAHSRGEPLDVIPPLKRVSFKSQVVAPRTSVQEYELAGRKTFVPVIAFNALYEWSGGKAQSSAAYLVGRDTQQDKLGPLRLDQGAREFSGLGARPLPSGVRT
jgi:hypothetical protein